MPQTMEVGHAARSVPVFEVIRFRPPFVFARRRSVGKPARSCVREVGLEPLEVAPAAFRAALSRRRQIKALLMDQTVIAGLSNIYCDESLHAAGIHPLTRADTLNSEWANRSLRAIRMTLRKAIRFNGSTLMNYCDADGREGSFQKLHRVYQRDGEPCRTCRMPIRRIQAAGRATGPGHPLASKPCSTWNTISRLVGADWAHWPEVHLNNVTGARSDCEFDRSADSCVARRANGGCRGL